MSSLKPPRYSVGNKMHKAFPMPDNTTTRKDDEQSGRTVTITTEDMHRKKNDVKARTTLLLSLLDEHQLRFSKFKTAKELWAAILKTFGGNEAINKRKKNLLKQQYGNFKAEGSETLEQTFNRLQVIVSQLQFIDVEVKKDDLNQKFLTSLAPEWLMHTIVWRNKNDLDTMSLDDLCNHLKSNGSQIKFKDINQIDEDDMEEIDIKWSMALLSMRADKFWKRTGNKISIQGSDVAGFDKSKVKCFNCHKMGHFARECRAPRSRERGRKENYRQGSKAKEKTLKPLMAIDGVGWDWSYMANEGEDHALVADAEARIEFALMANTESKIFDNSLCSNDCKKNNDSLNSILVKYKEREVKYIEKIRTLEMYRASNLKCNKTLDKELKELKLEKDGLDGKLAGLLKASKNLDNLIESQRPSPTVASTSAEGQNKDSSTSEDVASPNTPKPFIKFVKPKDSQSESPEFVLNKKAYFNCGDFSHLANDCRKRVHWKTTRSQNHAYKSPSHKSGGHRPHGAPMRPPLRSIGHRPHGGSMRPSHRPAGYRPHGPSMNPMRPKMNEEIFPLSIGNFLLLAENLPVVAQKFTLLIWEEREKLSQNNIDDKGYWDSGCSRHMTGNISDLSDFEPFNGGYVSFGQGGCNITCKGTIKT
nr:hypothetical protein [Tanacetum cinerariifolium]